MKQIMPNIYTFERLLAGRVYLLADDDGLTLVDSSIANAGPKIIKQVREHGFDPQDVRRILITHAHPDHVGGLSHLVTETGAEVWAHTLEKPVIEGQAPITRPETGFKPPETRFEGVAVSRTLDDGEQLPILGGLQVLHTPGHAPGHITFWHEDRKLAIIGDVIFFFFNRMTQPLRLLTPDLAENRRSIKRVYDLAPETLLFGHGQPLVGDAMATLTPFVERLGLA